MPRWTWHIETGILRTAQQGFSLETDDGGVWTLDIVDAQSAQRMLGQRVMVEGVHTGPDLIDVYCMGLDDGRAA